MVETRGLIARQAFAFFGGTTTHFFTHLRLAPLRDRVAHFTSFLVTPFSSVRVRLMA